MVKAKPLTRAEVKAAIKDLNQVLKKIKAGLKVYEDKAKEASKMVLQAKRNETAVSKKLTKAKKAAMKGYDKVTQKILALKSISTTRKSC